MSQWTAVYISIQYMVLWDLSQAIEFTVLQTFFYDILSNSSTFFQFLPSCSLSCHPHFPILFSCFLQPHTYLPAAPGRHFPSPPNLLFLHRLSASLSSFHWCLSISQPDLLSAALSAALHFFLVTTAASNCFRWWPVSCKEHLTLAAGQK